MPSLQDLFGGQSASVNVQQAPTLLPEQLERLLQFLMGETGPQQGLQGLLGRLESGEAFDVGVAAPATEHFFDKILGKSQKDFQRGLFSSDKFGAVERQTQEFGRGLSQLRAQDVGRRQQLQAGIGGNLMQALLSALGIRGFENIVSADPGSESPLAALLGAGGRLIAGAGAGGRTS